MGKGIEGILASNLILYLTAFAISWYTYFKYDEVFQALTGFLAGMTLIGLILRGLGQTNTKGRKCVFLLVHLGQCLTALALFIYASIHTANDCFWISGYGFFTFCQYRISICAIYFLAFAGEVACIKAVKTEQIQRIEPVVVYPTQTVVHVVPESQNVQMAPTVQTYPVHTVAQPMPTTMVQTYPVHTVAQPMPKTMVQTSPSTISQPVSNVQYVPIAAQTPQQ